MTTCVGLLRGINVGGNRMVPMAKLRELCADLGWQDVQTHIQSGNLVFTAAGGARALEAAIEKAVEKHFGFHVDIAVRSAKQWAECMRTNPFRDAIADEPARVLMGVAKAKVLPTAVAQLQERAGRRERVAVAGNVLWFHFADGVGRSKMTPAVIDRAAGSPVTARNWNTVLRLGEMAGIPPPD
jgi:uncharacterized protein (DUF1697 family)